MPTSALSRRSLPLTLLTCLFLLSGCTPSTPSGATGKQVAVSLLAKQGNGLIRLVRFEQTNGQQGELLGVPTYTLSYEAEIELLDDCYWKGEAFAARPLDARAGSMQDYLIRGTLGMQRGTRGERHTLQGEMAFEKTERGWQQIVF